MAGPTRRASLLVALLLVASVGTASAECAWVLWEQSMHWRAPGERDKPGVQTSEPSVLSGFQSHTACIDASQKKAEEQKSIMSAAGAGTANAFSLDEGGWRFSMKFTHGAAMTTTYRCLPDTIDPRGPKR